MKKIAIYKSYTDETGKKIQQTLRQVSLDKSFNGFKSSNKIVKSEFDNLAKDLEPTSTGWYFIIN